MLKCVTVCWTLPGERIKHWMELGFWVEAARPLWLVLGSNHASGSGGEACWAGRWNFSGPRQFRRPLPTQPQLSVIRPNAAYTDRALSRFVQPVLAVRLRWLRVHCGTHRAVSRRFEDRSFLLLTSSCSRVSFVSCASDTCGVEVCAGPNPAVSLSLCYSPAYSSRSHSASAFADVNQRLAWGTSVLMATVLND